MPPTPVLRWSMAAREMGSLCSCNGSKGSCGIFEPEGFRPVRVVMARASVMEEMWAPQRKQWHLDKHRKRPMLRVTRKQYPLAPAFAITAHAAQGQTAKAKVVADLHIGDSGDPLTAYVAVTRVTGREKLAVLRPFTARPYQQGTRLGRSLLLKVWRGEQIDWERLRAKYVEEKPCAECGVQKRKKEYTTGQWKRDENKRICKECVARHVEDGEPWQCFVCACWRGPAQFPAKHQRAQCAFYRVCMTCQDLKNKNARSVNDGSRKKSSARDNGSGRVRGNASAGHARNMDSGHALCATPVVCAHTSHVGAKPGHAGKTDARSVIYAYT